LVGVAFLGTLQTERARAHAQAISESLSFGDPGVAARLQQNVSAIALAVTDPARRSAEATASLGAALQEQANVLAFNDTCWAVTWIALAAALVLLGFIINSRFGLFRTRGATGATR
jgi:hypothetical protein